MNYVDASDLTLSDMGSMSGMGGGMGGSRGDRNVDSKDSPNKSDGANSTPTVEQTSYVRKVDTNSGNSQKGFDNFGGQMPFQVHILIFLYRSQFKNYPNDRSAHIKQQIRAAE